MKTISNKEWQHRSYSLLEKKVLSMGNTGASLILKEHGFYLLSLYRECLADMEGQLSFRIMEDIFCEIKKIANL